MRFGCQNFKNSANAASEMIAATTSTNHGPWLVDVVAAIISLAALALFLKFWHPKRIWRFPGEAPATEAHATGKKKAEPRVAIGEQEELKTYENTEFRNPK